VREARRTCFPRPWHAPRVNRHVSLHLEQLTEENKELLGDIFNDQYKDRLAAVGSPLKEGPWKRQPWTDR